MVLVFGERGSKVVKPVMMSSILKESRAEEQSFDAIGNEAR